MTSIDMLKEKKIKVTTQRIVLLDILKDNKGKHLSCDDILEKAKSKIKDLGLATVYRTVQLFEKSGVVEKVDIGDNFARYELTDTNCPHGHHHLVCMECGKIDEIREDLLFILENEIEEKNGFETTSHNVIFYGKCKTCRQK